MTLTTYSAILIAIYIGVLAYLTFRTHKSETPEQYAIGDRKVGLWNTIASIAAGQRDGSGIVVWVTLGILFGISTMWAFAGFAAGLLVLAFGARYVRNQAKEINAITISDIFKHAIGPRTAVASSIIIAAVAFLIAAAQVNIAGSIFGLLFNIPTGVGIVVTAIIVGVYLFFGGYQTVIKTDMLQWLIILTILFIPFLLMNGPVSDLPYSGIMEMDNAMALGLFGIAFLVIFSSADVWQRLFSARTDGIARKSALLAIPVYFIIALGSLALGLVAGTFVEVLDPGNAFFEMFASPTAPVAVLALLGVFVLAASMSTFDTHTFMFAQVVSRSLLARRFVHIERTKLTRIVLILFLVALIGLALTISNILVFVFGAFTLITVLAPLLALYLMKRLPERGNFDTYVIGVLILSVGVYSWLFIFGYFENVAYTVVPAAVAAVLTVLALAFYKVVGRKVKSPQADNGDEHFFKPILFLFPDLLKKDVSKESDVVSWQNDYLSKDKNVKKYIYKACESLQIIGISYLKYQKELKRYSDDELSIKSGLIVGKNFEVEARLMLRRALELLIETWHFKSITKNKERIFRHFFLIKNLQAFHVRKKNTKYFCDFDLEFDAKAIGDIQKALDTLSTSIVFYLTKNKDYKKDGDVKELTKNFRVLLEDAMPNMPDGVRIMVGDSYQLYAESSEVVHGSSGGPEFNLSNYHQGITALYARTAILASNVLKHLAVIGEDEINDNELKEAINELKTDQISNEFVLTVGDRVMVLGQIEAVIKEVASTRFGCKKYRVEYDDKRGDWSWSFNREWFLLKDLRKVCE